jgi:predicted nucleic acid-binding protein
VATEKFASASTPCALIFCDANYLFDLALFGSKPLQASANPRQIQRATEAATFYLRYLNTHSTAFISSPYALEEIAHKVGMDALGKTPAKSWKDLRNSDPTRFAATRLAALSIINELWLQLNKNYAIAFSVPRISSGIRRRTVVTIEVAEAALTVHRAYDKLDMMDAFHIAMALASGAKWIASSDQAFESVSEVNVFTGRP